MLLAGESEMKMNSQVTLTLVLNTNNIQYQRYISPRGLTYDLRFGYKGQTYKITVFCEYNDFNIKSFQIISPQPVNPDKFYSAQIDLYLENKNQRRFKWRMTDDGHYCLQTWNIFDKAIESYPTLMNQMIHRYLKVEPYFRY